ncbi:MAG: hypothetical protein OEP48_03255 [Betaproteobacteria bacterium]|nr:hypothetical protein [Betaproteobacteria bacterium]MDH3436269.1 hypothetical protein [Betaproteobacteria bacterium]
MALNERNTDGLERDPRLDRLYPQTGLEEPRAELDATIRAAARREVQARPHALGARLRRWRLPISIAAMVMLSVSVVTLMREEGADRFEEGLPPTMVEPRTPAASPGDDADLKTKESADSVGRAQVPAPQALPAPAAGLTAPSVDEARRARRLDAPAAGQLKPVEPSPAEIRQRAAGAANESASQRPASAAPAKRPARRAARVLSAPAPSTKEALVEAEEDSAGKRELKKSERSLTESRVNALIRELEGASPEVWLEKIERLRREGWNEEADDLVVEFRRRFPEHPMPAREGARGN